MKHFSLREGEEIIWEAKPEYTKSTFTNALIHAVIFPILVMAFVLVVLTLSFAYGLINHYGFLSLSCVAVPVACFIIWNLAESYSSIRQSCYLLTNERIIKASRKALESLMWSDVLGIEDAVLNDGFHNVQINHLRLVNLKETDKLISLIRDYSPDAFIQQSSAGVELEAQLQAEEAILWRGKPQLSTVHWREITSPKALINFLLVTFVFALSLAYTQFFFFIWFACVIVPLLIWIIFDVRKISQSYKHALYMISNQRLIIADSKQNKILFWTPLEAVSGFGEIRDVHQLYTLDFGHGFAFSRLSPEQVKEITRVLAPYMTKSEKNKPHLQ
jgi:hypothetical protein